MAGWKSMLGRKQQEAIAALLTQRNVEEAARAAVTITIPIGDMCHFVTRGNLGTRMAAFKAYSWSSPLPAEPLDSRAGWGRRPP